VKFIKRITKPLHPRDEVVFLLPEWARLGVKGGGAVRTFLTILAATVCAVVASIGVHKWYRMRPSEPTIAVWQTSAVPATPTAQPERWSYADLMRLKAKMSEADRQVVADVLRGHTREVPAGDSAAAGRREPWRRGRVEARIAGEFGRSAGGKSRRYFQKIPATLKDIILAVRAFL
jgi:hypothetical protein